MVEWQQKGLQSICQMPQLRFGKESGRDPGPQMGVLLASMRLSSIINIRTDIKNPGFVERSVMKLNLAVVDARRLEQSVKATLLIPQYQNRDP
jgi:hypothetical protein